MAKQRRGFRKENKNMVSNRSNDTLIHDSKAPPGRHLVICVTKGLAAGDEQRVIASFASGKSGVFAQITTNVGSSTLALFELNRGVIRSLCKEEQLFGVGPGDWLTLAVCCDEGRIAAMAANRSGAVVRCKGLSAIAGTGWGLGTGDVVREVRFDEIKCLHHFKTACNEHPLTSQAGCPSCGQTCPCCEIDFRQN